MKIFYSTLYTMLVVSILFASTAVSQVYKLVDLGLMFPTGINDSGQICGWHWDGGDSYRAYLWQNGGTTDLGSFGGGGSSTASGINNSGKIAGTSWPGTDFAHRHAFVWQHGIMTDLGTLGGSISEANGINDSGHIAGNSWLPGDTINRGFFWKNGTMTDLGTLGGTFSYAVAINNSDQVAGGGTLPAANPNDELHHASIWQNGAMTDLGTIAGDFSDATAINNAGHVVGLSTYGNLETVEGYIWNGGMSYLGGIPPSGVAFPPTGINNSDVVVGNSSWNDTTGQGIQHAFVWQNGVTTDLNGVSDTSGGWRLDGATSINNRGDIVGTAYYVTNGLGERHGILLRRSGLVVTKPKAGDLWMSQDSEQIRWLGPSGKLVNLYYTTDVRANNPVWTPIAQNIPSDLQKYGWKIPDGINSQFAAIRIEVASDLNNTATSERFRIRTLEMVRLNSDSTYTEFTHGIDSWSIPNQQSAMWPASWYARFSYKTGTDPFLNKQYPTDSPFDSALVSDFPDWPLFVRVFGEDYCYHPTWYGLSRDYNQLATAKWKKVKGTWAGSCSGLSLSSILGFDNRQSVVTRYPSYPVSGPINGVAISDSLRLIINDLFQHWEGTQHQRYVKDAWSAQPRDLIKLLRDAFLDETNNHRYLYINWKISKDTIAAHAIVPYKLERDTANAGWYKVWVYDVSYPQSNLERVWIDSTGDSAVAPRWSPRKLEKAILMDQSSTYLYPPNPNAEISRTFIPATPATTPATIEVWPGLNSSVRIEQSHRGVLEYLNGSILDSLQGGIYFIPPTASPSPPAVYTVLEDSCRITLGGFTDQHAGVSIFGYPYEYGYERYDADSTQTDILNFNNGLTIGNHDGISKHITMESILNVGDGDIKYRLSGMALNQDDSLSIAQKNVVGLTLVNRGSARQSNIFVKRSTYHKPGTFNYSGLTIPGNAVLWFTPGNDSLTTLRILIDNGIDGTFDDTLIVANQVTAVPGDRRSELPKEFALYQNYPNPFNPVTTIEYAVPSISHVSLKIFNVLGREVATLVNGIKVPGVYSATWDASREPSGVYFYRLQAGLFSETKKLLLLK
jgi:probable HAF family extracellular repeat protein